MDRRTERIGQEIKKEISMILQNEIKDPRLSAMPGVLAVNVTKDMSYADIYVSLFGSKESISESLEAIKSASGYIRHLIAKRIKLRHMPELRFKCDDYIEEGFRISGILDSINEEKNDENR